LQDIAHPGLVSGRASNVVLIDDGQDRPGDYIPVVVERKRNHRLNVDEGFVTVGCADILILVVLDRNADQARDRIGEFLGKFLGILRKRLVRNAGKRQSQNTRHYPGIWGIHDQVFSYICIG
jgi:hypothetical protein